MNGQADLRAFYSNFRTMEELFFALFDLHAQRVIDTAARRPRTGREPNSCGVSSPRCEWSRTGCSHIATSTGAGFYLCLHTWSGTTTEPRRPPCSHGTW
ncbi:hypothetical protein [Streptomyces sp. NPDC056938]|uniref:hypothetical protein n=1 Tax=unclassified Streptomyces TaxID=2593676 RepID=UPI00362C3F01